MEQVHTDQIEEIMRNMKCLKGFHCYEQKFEGPCQTVDVGLPSFVQCSENNPEGCGVGCPFKFSFRLASYCHCALRVYATKNLKK